MACRRRHGISRSSTFNEEIYRPPDDDTTSSSSVVAAASAPSSSRTGGVHRYSSLASDYANSPIQDRSKVQNAQREADPRLQSAKPETKYEHQLKATREVAIAAAAKTKLLLREMKTVKADLAFAKEKMCQLEEENRMLREGHEEGDHPADDDMIRVQLEMLVAEKACLAYKNFVYARENHCLREIIKYHKLGMQDVVCLDEGIEEVVEDNPRLSMTLSVSPPQASSTLRN